MLALQSERVWGSVFNLEDKMARQIGVGSFVGHMNKLFSTEDIFKRNCSRLRGNTSRLQWQLDNPDGEENDNSH